MINHVKIICRSQVARLLAQGCMEQLVLDNVADWCLDNLSCSCTTKVPRLDCHLCAICNRFIVNTKPSTDNTKHSW